MIIATFRRRMAAGAVCRLLIEMACDESQTCDEQSVLRDLAYELAVDIATYEADPQHSTTTPTPAT